MDVNEELKFCENSKKIIGGGESGGRGVGLGGQGDCERRIEVFVKIQKKKLDRGGGSAGEGGRVGWSG